LPDSEPRKPSTRLFDRLYCVDTAGSWRAIDPLNRCVGSGQQTTLTARQTAHRHDISASPPPLPASNCIESSVGNTQCIAARSPTPADDALQPNRVMELEPLAAQPPLARPRANTGSRSLGHKPSIRSQNLARGPGLRESRQRRSPPAPLSRDDEKTTTITTTRTKDLLTPPDRTPKPLLPASERRPGDEGKMGKLRRDGVEGEKGDITPDGGSAGREGRHFTVANVGNNGKIYLR
jgi:hypothetical protein